MSSENMTQETAQTSANTSSVEATTASSSVQTESTPQTATPSQETQSASTPSVETQAAPQVIPPWQPNYKFKAFDKEHELDPLFRPLVKDAETEKQIKSFASKAFALEPMKAEKERVKTEYEAYKTTHEPTIRAVSHLNKLLQTKDYSNFFKGLKIPDEEIFEYARKKLETLQMPADQRAELERQDQVRMDNYQLENKYSEMETRFREQTTATRKMEFQYVLQRPDVSSYEQSWDRQSGEIGAFRKLVISEAQANFYQTGQDWSAEEAVNHVVQKFGKFVQPQAANVIAPTPSNPNPTQPSQMGQEVPAGTAGRPPIIPNVAGRGTSPVKKRVTSIDDLKKLAKAMG